jgi:Uma2 family endonuclease
MTVAELERDGPPEGRWELTDGELAEMAAAGRGHGRQSIRLASWLSVCVEPYRLGVVYDSSTGFVISEDPPTVRVPDVGFVRTERLPANFDDGAFLRVVPDLVIDVTSPHDRPVEVLAKVVMWLEAGVAMVWVVNSAAESVTVYTSTTDPRVLSGDDVLDGGEILLGFTLPVREIFAI